MTYNHAVNFFGLHRVIPVSSISLCPSWHKGTQTAFQYLNIKPWPTLSQLQKKQQVISFQIDKLIVIHSPQQSPTISLWWWKSRRISLWWWKRMAFRVFSYFAHMETVWFIPTPNKNSWRSHTHREYAYSQYTITLLLSMKVIPFQVSSLHLPGEGHRQTQHDSHLRWPSVGGERSYEEQKQYVCVRIVVLWGGCSQQKRRWWVILSCA